MAENLKDKLFDNKKVGFEVISDMEKVKVFDFNDGYIDFLNKCKTERECVIYAKEYLKSKGFVDIALKENLNIGDKVYYINRKKSIYAAVLGSENVSSGLNLIGAHLDSPRIDLKPNPLYEDLNLALLKTHYYGGIKKYQWTTIPLAIHGIIVKGNGDVVEVNIGENENDPIFTITDLLPHLGAKQGKKTLNEGIAGEDLNLLVGSIPFKADDIDEKVKLNILNILNIKYGITERDFISSELELVPAFKAKSLGFDASMVAGYGQDDKACAYPALRAIGEIVKPNKTAVMILTDKEEIGSMGNTGMESRTFELFISMLLNKTGQNDYSALDETLNNSKMLSADVTSASDPTYVDVDEKLNAAYLGKGIALAKYTGSRGKGGSNDTHAEFIGYVRRILENNDILYQMTDMGKVDEGGGGTIAYILANRGIDVIDCGACVLSMHSPYEVTSKFDIYNSYEFYKAFYRA